MIRTLFSAGLILPLVIGTADQHSTCANSGSAPRALTVASSETIVDIAKSTGVHNTLVKAVVAADLVDALSGPGPLTVFAPTDEAFAALDPHVLESLLAPENKSKLQAILTYHVVPGELAAEQVVRTSRTTTLNGQSVGIQLDDHGVRIGDANVIQTDVAASNGIVHVIDSVLLPNDRDLIDTAIAAGSFTTLAKALGAADLVETLKGDGPFTVLAPTDEAFAALGADTLESLLEPGNRDKLSAILTYHVVPGRIEAAHAAAAQTADTVGGGALRFRIAEGRLMVNDSKLVSTDLETTNGVIHVIDRVLLP